MRLYGVCFVYGCMRRSVQGTSHSHLLSFHYHCVASLSGLTVTTVRAGPSTVRAGPSGRRAVALDATGCPAMDVPRPVGLPGRRLPCRRVPGRRISGAGPGRYRGCSATDGVWTSPGRAVAGGALPSGWRLPGRSGAGSRVPVVRAVRNGGYLLAGCWLTPHRFDKFSKPLNHAGSTLEKGR